MKRYITKRNAFKALETEVGGGVFEGEPVKEVSHRLKARRTEGTGQIGERRHEWRQEGCLLAELF